MATINGGITVSTSFRQVTANGLGGSTQSTGGNQNYQTNFVAGAAGAADVVDRKHSKVYTLAGAATTIDLLTVLDDAGAACAFARIMTITVRNRSTTGGQKVTVSPGASNGWDAAIAGGVVVPASTSGTQAVLALVNPLGFAVDSTHKTLKFDPGTDTITIDVEIVGASA